MAKLRTSIQGRDSLQKHAVVDRLHQIIDRALPQTPDAVGFLLSSGADDHRYVPGRLVAGDGARRLVSVRAGHDDIHQNERSEEHTSELQSPDHLVCRLLLEKKKK